MKKRFGFFRIFFGAIICLLFLWGMAGFPRSLLEYNFHAALKSISLSTSAEVSLTALMPTDWETVCDSHGYSGDFYVKKYNKKFPAAGQMQNGAWGLTFIYPDGTYDQISSSCGHGSYINLKSCFTRNEATLHLSRNAENEKCVYFQSR